MHIRGQFLNYYLVCKRKLYLSAHNIKCEDNSELVKIGKYLHEQKAIRAKGAEDNEILIDNIKIDSIDGDYVVEYKKKNSSTEAAKAQLLFYLYVLSQKGVHKKGLLKFKESKKNIEVELNRQSEPYIQDLIKKTENLIHSDEIPKVIDKPKCKKCAYYDYCYS